MSVKDETEIQNMSQQASQGQLVPGGVDEEKAAKPKEKDISGSETAVEAKSGGKGMKMCIIATVIFLILVGVAVAVIFIFFVGLDGGPIRSRHYAVGYTMSKDIVLSPKEDVTQEYTLIWLHGLESNAREAARMFANQPEENRITPDSMKIVIPRSQHDVKKDEEKEKDMDDKKENKEDKEDDASPPKVDDDKNDDDDDKKSDDKKGKKPEYFIDMSVWSGSYTLADMKKDATGDDKETVAYWESMFDQEKLKTQADKVIEIIKTEVVKLNNDYSKVLIGGLNEGAVIALASYLSYADDANPLGGVVSIGGIQALTTY